MNQSKLWAPLVAAAFALSLGLAACGEGTTDQQSSNPDSEQPGDAAATTESGTQSATE